VHADVENSSERYADGVEQKKPDRSSLYIGAAVAGSFVLLGFFTYWHEQSTHGPFPGDEYLASEVSEAQSTAPGATLAYVSATYVTEHGAVQAAFGDGRYWHNAGYVTAWFLARPPAQATAEAEPTPLGAPVLHPAAAPPSKCPMLRLSAGLHGAGKQTHFGIESAWHDRDACDAPLPQPVHCKLAGVWHKAIAAGAPHDAFADLTLSATQAGQALWHFSIVDHAHDDKVVFEGLYPDDCPP
jgi:hypothetical protein